MFLYYYINSIQFSYINYILHNLIIYIREEEEFYEHNDNLHAFVEF